MKRLTLARAKKLKYGETLYHIHRKNKDNTPLKIRVNGAVKRWKRDQDRIQIPIKHGLYSYGYLTNYDFDKNGRSIYFNVE